MRLARTVLALAGFGMLAWGGSHLSDTLTDRPTALSTLTWLAAGPLITDLVLLPVAGPFGWASALLLPRALRGPVAVGLAVSAVLAIPFLWRPFAPNLNPGLNDRDYPLGLAGALVVVWALTLSAAAARWWHSR
jgi:hypothetical protein